MRDRVLALVHSLTCIFAEFETPVPVLLSRNPAHALPSASAQLRGPNREDIFLDNDGFMVVRAAGVEEPLPLFWLPAHLRDIFDRGGIFIGRPRLLLQMGSTVDLDLSQLAHGADWARCYQPPESTKTQRLLTCGFQGS